MIQCGGRAGFELEACEAIGIDRHIRGQDLDRDFPVQSRVTRAVHLAHSTCAQSGKHLIWTEVLTDHSVGPHSDMRPVSL